MKLKKMKIAVTGGPGGGKTTALDLFQREFDQRVHIVPEAATILFQSGVKRAETKEKQKDVQIAIYQMQTTMEEIYARLYPDKLLVCDRGTLDGLAYWPDQNSEEFFTMANSSYEQELQRYDAIIFFETAACQGHNYLSNNPFRVESMNQAVTLDKKLQDIWSKHPNYFFIPTHDSFLIKINQGVKAILNALNGKKA